MGTAHTAENNGESFLEYEGGTPGTEYKNNGGRGHKNEENREGEKAPMPPAVRELQDAGEKVQQNYLTGTGVGPSGNGC